MRIPWHCRLGEAVGFAALAMLAGVSATSAQDRPKIEITPRIAHSGAVASVASSPDGKRLLSGSGDKTIKLWDVASGRLIRTFESHADITSVAFSPDGKRVLSGSGDNTLKLWDAASGSPIRPFEGHADWVTSVAFSPDGKRVLSGSGDKTIKLWDAASGRPIRTFKGQAPVRSVAFSTDGKRLLSGGVDGTLALWDAASGQLFRTLAGPGSYGVNAAAFSPDGTRVASYRGALELRDAASGQLIRTFMGHAGHVNSVAFSPDGTRLLSGGYDKTLKLWEAATGRLIHTFEGHGDAVNSVAFLPDGKHLVSGGADSTLKLWDATAGGLIRTFEAHGDAVNAVAFSPDGKRVLAGGRSLVLWDAATGQLIRTSKRHSHPISSVAFSPDGKRLLSGSDDGKLEIRDAATDRLIRSIEGREGYVLGSVAFSPDGTRLLTGGNDGKLELRDAATGRPIRTFEGRKGEQREGDGLTAVAFSPDGKRLLSGSFDGMLMLWDAASGRSIRAMKGQSSVNAVAFSPDGTRLLSGGYDKMLELWDAATGRLIRTFVGHSGEVKSVAFSPDGTRLLSGGSDKTARLWNAATGTLVRTFEGHTDEVKSVAFSPDGIRIASGSRDATVRIWDTASGALIATLIGGRAGESLAITPKGFFASADGTEMLGITRGLESYSVMQFYDHLHRPDLVEQALKGDPEGKYKDAAYNLNLETILDSRPVPRIEHLEKRTERAGDTIKLAVRIVDTGGGIGQRVVWRVNGQTQGRVQPAELRGAQAPSLGAFALSETFRIDPSKDNIVELTAYNGAGLLATPPFRIVVPRDGVPTAEERPRMYVLAVGVDKYRMPDLELRYAVNDTFKFSKALELVGSALFAKVETTILANEQVTEDAIAAAFGRIGADAKTGDVFVLYLAGHGTSIEGKYYYYPQTLDFRAGQTVETHGIGQDKWQAWLAKVGHVEKSVLFLDTCYGGAATALVRGTRFTVIQAAVDQLKRATGQNLIAASRVAAFEGYREHGVLTYALLEALHKGDDSGDDSVRVGGLADYVNGRVPEITQELFGQQQWPIRRLSGIDFPIGIRRPVFEQRAGSIPKTPTHVLIRAERVREAPADDARGWRELRPGTLLRVIEFEAGWAVVARNGERLGYVPLEALAKTQ